MILRYALLVILEAKAGKEKEVEEFLKSTLELVEAEENTISWYAIKLSLNKFGIFDTFSDGDSRHQHLRGEVGRTLMEKAPNLFVKEPQIQQVTILAAKRSTRNLAL